MVIAFGCSKLFCKFGGEGNLLLFGGGIYASNNYWSHQNNSIGESEGELIRDQGKGHTANHKMLSSKFRIKLINHYFAFKPLMLFLLYIHLIYKQF